MSLNKRMMPSTIAHCMLMVCVFALFLSACAVSREGTSASDVSNGTQVTDESTSIMSQEEKEQEGKDQKDEEQNGSTPVPVKDSSIDETQPPSKPDGQSASAIRASLNITEDFRDSFIHGEKPADCQKYIVMHDTEGDAEATNVIEWWDSNGRFVASHFVVNKDGSIVQCVPLDKIAHHAGFGDAGHNELYGVQDESRDDKRGTESIGDWAPDYGMNSYSVGIEMVHVGSSGEDYPEEQLRAVDGLIAYIDSYYGFQSEIIDHNDWRTGNSDCSEEFQPYLRSLQSTRTHDGS